jgi:hypothetical protein
MGGSTYTVNYRVEGEKEDRVSKLMSILNITRGSTSSGVRSWNGIAKIGGSVYRALAYGEVPVSWILLHQVKANDILIDEVYADINRALGSGDGDEVIEHLQIARRRIRRFKHDK